ncbi:endolytic transglycosylase MltG [Frigidibacter sp. ROC022]|uniref:endolytic transglycosylase MltG n=1 Tax=Frigidibacter sp. ROC022 TaxID=2971796 RepID=UPI00215AF473|nr:endolytic transglycosylase MltG [Frigidibacter sp. ROC022]MCR8723620.1 endolytic transglycosylase MltG [Frigidibacter sp. ROC022]
MWRHIASNGMSLLIVLLIAAAGAIAWGKAKYQAPGPLAQAICLRVESGSSMRKVSEQLAEQGAVSAAWLFRLGAEYSGKSEALKAGSFLVTEGSSMAEIMDEITGSGVSTCGTEVVYRIGVNRAEMQVRELDPATNRFVEVAAFEPEDGAEPPPEYLEVRQAADTRYRVAMAEGATVWQVAEALKAADFMDGKITELPPEGSLAPDSYEVTPGADRAELLARMQAAQSARLAEAWRNRDEGLPVKTPEEALVLASLIEKETGVPEERRLVASVFVNRLNQGIKLQTDPAVIYGVTGGKGVLGRGLRQSELQRDTPYNTYVNAGLPPGPIANPGLAAIEAALHPESSDYIYFVADGTGGHAFARTLAEHNDNVAKWRKIEAERAAGDGD